MWASSCESCLPVRAGRVDKCKRVLGCETLGSGTVLLRMSWCRKFCLQSEKRHGASTTRSHQEHKLLNNEARNQTRRGPLGGRTSCTGLPISNEQVGAPKGAPTVTQTTESGVSSRRKGNRRWACVRRRASPYGAALILFSIVCVIPAQILAQSTPATPSSAPSSTAAPSSSTSGTSSIQASSAPSQDGSGSSSTLSPAPQASTDGNNNTSTVSSDAGLSPSEATTATASTSGNTTIGGSSMTMTSEPPTSSISGQTTNNSTGSSSINHQQQVNKPKLVNFTLVDELFSAPTEQEELVKRWKNMDNQFQEGIRSILKLIFPQIVAISQDAKVSGDCSGGILKWILSLRNLRSWAIKMLDATGKPTSGIFQGSLTMMGNYGQCLSVRAPDEDEIEITDQFEEYFRGQYCVIHLRPHLPKRTAYYHLNSTIDFLLRKNYKYYEKTLYDELAEIAIAFQFIDIRMDLCVPSTCTKADIQRVAELISKKLEFRAKVLRCDIEQRDSSGFGSALVNDQLVQLWLLVPSILFITTIFTTILVLLKRSYGTSSANTQEALRTRTPARDRAGSILHSLSLFGTVSRLLAVPQDISSISKGDRSHKSCSEQEELYAKPWPLYGLRSVFLIWFIIVQMTVQLKYQYLRESLVLRNMLLNYWPFQIIINTSMIFESLILITAFTYGYCNLNSSIKQLFKYTLLKYLRIIPSIILLIAVTLVTPSFGVLSPVWKNFVDEQASVCRSTGYLDLFFLQNFISYEKICIPHSWLVCVEFQLLIVAIPLVALMRRAFKEREAKLMSLMGEKDLEKTHPEVKSCYFCDNLIQLLKSQAGLLGMLIVLIGTSINFFNVYTNNLPPSWFNTFPDVDDRNHYFGAHLAKTWTHLSTFVLGLFMGHLCRSTILLRNSITSHEQQQQQRSRDRSIDSDNDCLNKINQQHENSCGLSKRQIANELTPSASIPSITDSCPSSNRGLFITVPQRSSETCSSSSSCNGNDPQKIGWSLFTVSASVCLLSIIFSTYTWSTQQLPSPMVSALFDSSTRLLWSLALVGIMVQLCLPRPHNNQLTKFAQLLSCKPSVVMGRLSLLAYLWTPYVHSFILAAQEQALFPSLYLIFHVIVGNILITYLVAFIASIFTEQPIRLAFEH